MYFDFFKQKHKRKITVGDEIALFTDSDDDVSSGRYTVAQIGADPEGYILAMLVGMGPREGEICQVPLGAYGE